MAIANFETREIHCKIIYFGASGVGKTENLRSIYRKTSPEVLAGLFDMKDISPSKMFEFLPVSLGYVRDYHIKLHLFTFQPFDLMPIASDTLMRGVDGVVFVNDARLMCLTENVEARQQMMEILKRYDYNFYEMPRVAQHNMMDKADLIPAKILKEELSLFGGEDCLSVASESEGTLETLKLISGQVLRQLANTPSSFLGG